jgi:hypothetical protein
LNCNALDGRKIANRDCEARKDPEGVTRISNVKDERITYRTRGNQAAYEKLVSDELCMKLSRKFARKSAKATGDDVGSIRVNYDEIVIELRGLRQTKRDGKRHSLSTILRSHYKTDEALTRFLSSLGKWIANYISHCIRGEHGPGWTLYGHAASTELMNALAHEYVRDRNGLMGFLSAVFQHWRQIFAPRSLWRVRLITQRIARRFGYDRKRILAHLQKTGDVPNKLTADQTYAWLSRIGQYLSRDQRTAAGKDFGFGSSEKAEDIHYVSQTKNRRRNRSDRNPLTAS